MKYILAIGSNIRPHVHVRQVLKKMVHTFDEVRVGKFFYSPAYGMHSHRLFWNGAVSIDTHLSPAALKMLLCQWEKESGRNRDHPKCSLRDRTLDMDIIWGASCGWLESIACLRERPYVWLPISSLLDLKGGVCEPLHPIFFSLSGKVLGRRPRTLLSSR